MRLPHTDEPVIPGAQGALKAAEMQLQSARHDHADLHPAVEMHLQRLGSPGRVSSRPQRMLRVQMMIMGLRKS
jgi:hypothetical protein